MYMYTVKVPLMHIHILECVTYFSKFKCKVYCDIALKKKGIINTLASL